MPRQKPLSYFFVFISLITYCFIAYTIQRHESIFLLSFYFLLFAIYVWVVKEVEESEITFWIYVAVGLRLSLLIAMPNLSDDFYRFIWDGRLLANGIHPFAQIPGYYIESGLTIPGIDRALFDQLNSQNYFTIYPPLAQFVFWIAVLISPQSLLGSVVVMRVFILAAEIGSLFLLRKLLSRFNVDAKNILLYALNPLAILELTGNLHFEAFVICFVLGALYLITEKKILKAGMSFGLAVSAKLLPLIFLPLFLLHLGLKRALLFYAAVGVACLILFAPLFDREILEGFSESVELYFRKFEFNASIYYLVREYGFLTKGYNTIQAVGWKLGLIATIVILFISFWPYVIKEQGGKIKLVLTAHHLDAINKIPQVMMWIMLTYFLFTTTLHPWYITTLLMLSIFTSFRFVVIWTAMIFLTYAGYTISGFTETLSLTVMEYVVVIGYLVYELAWQRKYLLV